MILIGGICSVDLFFFFLLIGRGKNGAGKEERIKADV